MGSTSERFLPGRRSPVCRDQIRHRFLFYRTPADIFSLAYPESPVPVDNLTIICWLLPQTAATKADRRRQRKFSSARWARSRNFGEDANLRMARHLIEHLKQKGHLAVAPVLHPSWGWQASDKW